VPRAQQHKHHSALCFASILTTTLLCCLADICAGIPESAAHRAAGPAAGGAAPAAGGAAAPAAGGAAPAAAGAAPAAGGPPAPQAFDMFGGGGGGGGGGAGGAAAGGGGGGGGALEALRGTPQMQMLRRAVMANPELLGPMLQVRLGSTRVLRVVKIRSLLFGLVHWLRGWESLPGVVTQCAQAQQQGVSVAGCAEGVEGRITHADTAPRSDGKPWTARPCAAGNAGVDKGLLGSARHVARTVFGKRGSCVRGCGLRGALRCAQQRLVIGASVCWRCTGSAEVNATNADAAQVMAALRWTRGAWLACACGAVAIGTKGK
jgi:hypothetical protein